MAITPFISWHPYPSIPIGELWYITINSDPVPCSPQNMWLFPFLQCTVIHLSASGYLCGRSTGIITIYIWHVAWFSSGGLAKSSVSCLKTGTGVGTGQEIVTFYWDYPPQPSAHPFFLLCMLSNCHWLLVYFTPSDTMFYGPSSQLPHGCCSNILVTVIGTLPPLQLLRVKCCLSLCYFKYPSSSLPLMNQVLCSLSNSQAWPLKRSQRLVSL